MRSAALIGGLLVVVAFAMRVDAGASRVTSSATRDVRAPAIDRGWRRVLISNEPPGGDARYLVAGRRRGFLVVGQGSTSCCTGGVGTWFSRDGALWRPGRDEAFYLPEQTVYDASVDVIAGWRDGFIAVGAQRLRTLEDQFPATGTPRVWLSHDGASWVMEPGEQPFGKSAFVDVAVGHDRVVLAAIEGDWNEPQLPTTWTSRDARTWQRASGNPFAGFAQVHVTAAPDGFLAWADARADRGRTDPVLWISADGATWDSVPTGDAFVGLGIDRIITVGSDLLAIASRSCAKRFLVSRDGRRWHGASDGPEAPDEATWPCASTVAAAAAGRAGIIAVGTSHVREAGWDARAGSEWTRSPVPSPMIWFSATGRTWRRLPLATLLAPTEWGAITLAGVVASDDGFVVAGGVPLEPGNKPNVAPAVWLWPGR